MNKRKSSSKSDPIEEQIESRFRPGTFIRDGECFSFVSGLEEVAATIGKLVTSNRRAPSRCTRLSWQDAMRKR